MGGGEHIELVEEGNTWNEREREREPKRISGMKGKDT